MDSHTYRRLVCLGVFGVILLSRRTDHLRRNPDTNSPALSPISHRTNHQRGQSICLICVECVEGMGSCLCRPRKTSWSELHKHNLTTLWVSFISRVFHRFSCVHVVPADWGIWIPVLSIWSLLYFRLWMIIMSLNIQESPRDPQMQHWTTTRHLKVIHTFTGLNNRSPSVEWREISHCREKRPEPNGTFPSTIPSGTKCGIWWVSCGVGNTNLFVPKFNLRYLELSPVEGLSLSRTGTTGAGMCLWWRSLWKKKLSSISATSREGYERAVRLAARLHRKGNRRFYSWRWHRKESPRSNEELRE